MQWECPPAVERARHLQRTGGIASTERSSSTTMYLPWERSVAAEVAELDVDGHVGRGNRHRRSASTPYRAFAENETQSVRETSDTEKRRKKKRFMFFSFLNTFLHFLFSCCWDGRATLHKSNCRCRVGVNPVASLGGPPRVTPSRGWHPSENKFVGWI